MYPRSVANRARAKKMVFSSLAEKNALPSIPTSAHQGQIRPDLTYMNATFLKPMPGKRNGKHGRIPASTLEIGTRKKAAASIGMKQGAKRAGLRHQQPTSV
jgi:hypothetical protein